MILVCTVIVDIWWACDCILCQTLHRQRPVSKDLGHCFVPEQLDGIWRGRDPARADRGKGFAQFLTNWRREPSFLTADNGYFVSLLMLCFKKSQTSCFAIFKNSFIVLCEMIVSVTEKLSSKRDIIYNIVSARLFKTANADEDVLSVVLENNLFSYVYCSAPSGGECIKQCPQQAFSDSSGWRCQPCHSSCQTCHGPRSTDCDLCLGGNPPLHGQCPLMNCPMGQYSDGKGNLCDEAWLIVINIGDFSQKNLSLFRD